MIGVILPSRGLMFSQTADEILRNLKGHSFKFFFAHKLPIPDCFEIPTGRALKDEVTHLWFVEDDQLIPDGTLQAMLDMDKAVVTCDYPVNADGRGSVFEVDGKVVFCGTGCLLVRREVFEEMQAPYFTADFRYNVKNYGTYIKMTPTRDLTEGYGLHDVNFCMNLYRRGIPIHKAPIKLGQRKLVELGKAGTNDGAHNIEVWKKIKKDHLLKKIKSTPPLPTGNMTTVITKDGEMTLSKPHAKKLIRKGIAKRPPRRKLMVDWSFVDDPTN